jgi:hypothetical protein
MDKQLANSDLLEKIANMLMYSVPHTQIAMVCGISEEQLEQILALPEFESQVATLEFANIESQKDLNEGWDSIETQALANLVTAMGTINDPEFSLKVAAVANKAQRRGGRHARPIEGDLGSRAVINLNQTFIERLQMNNQMVNTSETVADGDRRKDHNFLPPNAVERLLKIAKPESEVDALTAELPALAL